MLTPTNSQRNSDNSTELNLTGPSRDRGRRVAYVGKLSLEKGVHCLIAALPEIVTQVPDVHLLVIGEGVARKPLEKMVRALDRGDLAAAAQALAGAPAAPWEQRWIAPVTLFGNTWTKLPTWMRPELPAWQTG